MIYLSIFRSIRAQERTRTSTTRRSHAPEACASTNSATWACSKTSKIARSSHTMQYSFHHFLVRNIPGWVAFNRIFANKPGRWFTFREVQTVLYFRIQWNPNSKQKWYGSRNEQTNQRRAIQKNTGEDWNPYLPVCNGRFQSRCLGDCQPDSCP